MGFEVLREDLLGRLGRIETKSGMIETPAMLPVVNPSVQPIAPRAIFEDFRCKAIMANAYIIRKRFCNEALELGVHRLLDYRGVVATDSGGYQILEYGKADVTPREIVSFQEKIGTDIGVILDIPTGMTTSRSEAEATVRETVVRADDAMRTIRDRNILWMGPIQGGLHLDLVSDSAHQMSLRRFDILALGSPTPLMEHYMFDLLAGMILEAKRNVPIERPLHLFGAGHPLTFSLAVALGCDTFDSAAYAIFARQGRYMTPYGTVNLEELSYLPCSCSACGNRTLDDIKEFNRDERKRLLAEHNLYACLEEVKRIKQAIVEGRLWELVEARARGHPALHAAVKLVGKKCASLFERHAPVIKRRGIFIFDSLSLRRPELERYKSRIITRYRLPREARRLALLPSHKAGGASIFFGTRLEHREILRKSVHVCAYGIPYGIVPMELEDVYPFAQTEVSHPPDKDTIIWAAGVLQDYLRAHRYREVWFYDGSEAWHKAFRKAVTKRCKKLRIRLKIVSELNRSSRRRKSSAHQKPIGLR